MAPDAAIADAPCIRALLIEAARDGRAVSYSELLARLGLRFTRPKMRALCATLDAIDTAGRSAGEPELAVLVVRESDALPGQGWWTGGRALALGHDGAWTGPAALALVRRLQREAFEYWRGRPAAGPDRQRKRAARSPARPPCDGRGRIRPAGPPPHDD